MLQYVDQDALLAEGMTSRLARAGLASISAEVVEKHMAEELANAPKPMWFAGLRYIFFEALDNLWWTMTDSPLFFKERVYVMGPAAWERRIVESNLYYAHREVCDAARKAVEAVPEGQLVLFELIQDNKVVDPILAIEDKAGDEIVYLKIWNEERVIY